MSELGLGAPGSSDYIPGSRRRSHGQRRSRRHVAGRRAANRAFLLGMTRLEDRHRDRVVERRGRLVAKVAEALQAAVPELKAVPEGLRETIRGLLTDVSDWRARAWAGG
jgi:hypothetical protein